MEYFIGSLVTVATILFFGKLFSRQIQPAKRLSISYSQSYIHEVIKPALPIIEYLKQPEETQASKFNKELYTRIIIVDNFAYWIANSRLLSAPMENGLIQKESEKLVDTMAMDSVELKKMAFIVDKLTEGDTAK
jgi:hypothetical protein